MNAFRSAVVPAAGLGTRFLPTTKTVPKELLPVVDTPGIELVAAEAAAAGAEELLIVTSPGKDAVAAHFADSSELEKTLAARGKEKLVAKVRRAHELINARTVTQAEPLGLGHAVGCAREAIGPDEQAFAVLLPDDLVLPTGRPHPHGRGTRRGTAAACSARSTSRARRSPHTACSTSATPTTPTSNRSTAWSRSRPPTRRRPRSRRRVATCSTSRSSTRSTGSPRARAASCSSPTPSSC